MVFEADKLFLAEIRYFEHGIGVEESPVALYTILVKLDDGRYVNVLNVLENYPVCKISASDNRQISISSNIDKSGFVYTINEDRPLFNTSSKKITLDSLEDLVLNSKLYFPDKLEIAREKRRLNTNLEIVTKYIDVSKRHIEVIELLEKSKTGMENYFNERVRLRR